MQPSHLQYFVAQWLLRLWFWGWSAVGVVWVVVALFCGPPGENLLNPFSIMMILIALVLTGGIGFFSGLILACIVLPPVFHWRGNVNGAPFHDGDHVRILVGPHRDEIREIYAVWEERGEVRIDLGVEAAKKFTDVYSFLEVCREMK